MALDAKRLLEKWYIKELDRRSREMGLAGLFRR